MTPGPCRGTGFGYVNANTNKYFITLDYHVPESKPVFYNLVRQCDGLTECYRHGTFDKWKQGYRHLQELNPRFIYVWGGGFGYGPKIFGGSYDILGQAHAGLSSITGTHEDFGGHSTKSTNWVIDWYSGTQITVAALAALIWRQKTGLGTMIEFSQVQAATRCCAHTTPLYGNFGIVRQRWGNWDTQLCVHGIIMAGKSDFPDAVNPQEKYEARYVMLSAFADADFKALCDVIKKPDMFGSYKSHKERVGAPAQIAIYKAIEDWAADKSRSEVVRILKDAGLLAAPVMNDKEVYESEHYRQRGTVRWMDDPLVWRCGDAGWLLHRPDVQDPQKGEVALAAGGRRQRQDLPRNAGLSHEQDRRILLQGYSLSGGELCVISSGAKKKPAVKRAIPLITLTRIGSGTGKARSPAPAAVRSIIST